MTDFAPKKIIVHHSLTKDSETVSWGAIRKYHTHTLMWRDIGYHAGVELVKSGQESYYEALMGRMWDVSGAHTKGHNSNSLGICFIGNYDHRPPGPLILEAGAKVISLWLQLFGLGKDDVYPHSAFSTKTCPGILFDMENLKSHLKN